MFQVFHRSSPTSPTAAERSFQALSRHLASIHSLEEHTVITKMASKANFWVEGVDVNHNGLWEWIDGSGFDYSNWKSSQPDGGEYYMCIGNIDGGGDWRDWLVGFYGFYCQTRL